MSHDEGPPFPIDEQSGLEYVEHDGHRRILACLPDTRKRLYLPSHALVFGTIPESEWVEFDDDDQDIDILDQDGEPSCCGHGGAGSFQFAWLQAGNPKRKFAPTFLYSLVNGGRNQGANVGDLMDALKGKGICLYETMPDVHNVYERNQPAKAMEEASRFKLEESYRVSNWADIMSAVQLRKCVCIGIQIGRAFNPSRAGVLPPQRGSGGGHCLYLGGGAAKINGIWHAKGRNSWGTSWGDRGRFWIESSYFRGETDHYVPVAPKEDPQGPDKPPVVQA